MDTCYRSALLGGQNDVLVNDQTALNIQMIVLSVDCAMEKHSSVCQTLSIIWCEAMLVWVRDHV
jgi:hypothetical protein